MAQISFFFCLPCVPRNELISICASPCICKNNQLFPLDANQLICIVNVFWSSRQSFQEIIEWMTVGISNLIMTANKFENSVFLDLRTWSNLKTKRFSQMKRHYWHKRHSRQRTLLQFKNNCVGNFSEFLETHSKDGEKKSIVYIGFFIQI